MISITNKVLFLISILTLNFFSSCVRVADQNENKPQNTVTQNTAPADSSSSLVQEQINSPFYQGWEQGVHTQITFPKEQITEINFWTSANSIFTISPASLFILDEKNNWALVTHLTLESKKQSFVCNPGQHYLLKLNNSLVESYNKKRNNDAQKLHPSTIRIYCPKNYSLSNSNDFKEFNQLLNDSQQSDLYIGTLSLQASQLYELKLKTQIRKRIYIGYLKIFDVQNTKQPSHIVMETQRDREIEEQLISLEIEEQINRWNEYPIESKRSELRKEINERFLLSKKVVSFSEIINKYAPKLFFSIENGDGNLLIETKTSGGVRGVDGIDIAPNFYNTYIKNPAPSGVKGDNAVAENTLFVCYLRRGAGDGTNGHNGIYPGLSGSNGTRPIPAPEISVLFIEDKNRATINKINLTIKVSAKGTPALGGLGTHGQFGGKGGPGGDGVCHFSGGRAGADGKNAANGSNGNSTPEHHLTVCPNITYFKDLQQQNESNKNFQFTVDAIKECSSNIQTIPITQELLNDLLGSKKWIK